LYKTASSFPDGIDVAHEQLQAAIPHAAGRKYFGISRPEKGPIVYRAAVEETKQGEAEHYNCGRMVLKRGEYLCVNVPNYKEDPEGIARAFNKLLTHPGLDPEGYCVEWYRPRNPGEWTGADVRCMVRLKG
jgi:hypothetical protein